MSTAISIGKAKANLCALVDDAANGKSHVITVHEKPVAELRPARSKTREMAEVWKEKRKKILLNPPGMKRIEIADLYRAGRK